MNQPDDHIFRKLGSWQKAWLKLTDPKAYQSYKYRKQRDVLWQHIQNRPRVPLELKGQGPVHFRHGGNAGDVIYALPALRALADGRPATLWLEVDRPADYHFSLQHVMGNVMMNRRMVEMLMPLLSAQSYIHECAPYAGGPVDAELDAFRGGHILLDRHHIARWNFLLYGINADLGQPWLAAEPDTSLEKTIVLARSSRYHMQGITYHFLNDYEDLVFVGVPEEYEAMKRVLPKLQFRPVANFLELAQIIAGCRFFIGNQSFPFSIAEGLKVPRLLEVDINVPNVIVEGPNGYDFCFQEPFERLVHDLYYYGRRKMD
ncbi:MAG: hypothetical protein EOO15_11125 [Chitinophagaceae bacterium]|nr:MAG: hypothetical protein EOO15_11125 [Chitinophagaceae bacterium]